ncbi:acyltransferase [Danxiaibacter flavus]|uniref:Acyltransferase n=1 Tax=Danxiaibacter flavus TaxID=3049108 RepID=A0ABV3ZDM1_9BACT|nr:acyltransferase [Chitinophagaceae bacterium DXS]
MTHIKGIEKHQLTQKLFGLDHLRAFAICYVFFYHYGGIFAHPDWVLSLAEFGWTGVDLFFVLSGYLISSQLFEKIAKAKKISLKEFFIKRFFRIIPAYLVIVVLYFLFPLLREREAPAPLWKYLTFTQNLGLDLHSQGTFSHAWSLCIEEQFYLFMPLILLGLARFKMLKKGLVIILAFFVAGLLVRALLYNYQLTPYAQNDDFIIRWYKWIYYPTWSRLDGLLTGVSVAAIFQFKPQLSQLLRKNGNLLLLLSLSVLIAAYLLCKESSSFAASVVGFPLVSIGYGLMVAGAVSPSGLLFKFKSNATAAIAKLSYALYLSHKIVIHVTQVQFAKLDIDKNSNLMMFICISTSLLAAFILNKIVEKPFLLLRDKILNKRKQQVPKTRAVQY